MVCVYDKQLMIKALNTLIDDFVNSDELFLVFQNRTPDLPDELRFVGLFDNCEDAIDYADKVFDAYHLKGRADAYQIIVCRFKFEYNEVNENFDYILLDDDYFYFRYKFGD